MKIGQNFLLRSWAYGLVLVLMIPASGFVGFSIYLAFLSTTSPPVAALMAAAALILAALIICGTTSWVIRRRRRIYRRSSSSDNFPLDSLEEALQANTHPLIAAWARHNPGNAVLTSLALGIAAGYSRRMRTILSDFYQSYSEAEEERRNRK